MSTADADGSRGRAPPGSAGGAAGMPDPAVVPSQPTKVEAVQLTTAVSPSSSAAAMPTPAR
ncbi:hypothetical protein AUC47_09435 [Microbacterium sp. SZ1]|uniref:hypothetical protein n=1 Tax=Microbacterium sp. SZ1 TaxID=1849736 RepID=UPI000BBC638E|nr:hypothetical protein [Microbacterium sp. SZ1]PCE16160.1 hypothetical protein AUC47_09435 [Microbacterium sp. SZ1]